MDRIVIVSRVPSGHIYVWRAPLSACGVTMLAGAALDVACDAGVSTFVEGDAIAVVSAAAKQYRRSMPSANPHALVGQADPPDYTPRCEECGLDLSVCDECGAEFCTFCDELLNLCAVCQAKDDGSV